ncbi:MAG: 50S ribosomal protein L6 [Bacteroidales bacterium]|nr:50S ribosomal protein L6 [Bacteroidales bacterium]
MSRIGKLPIALPEGVQISISDDNVVTVKGKLGELQQKIDSNLKVKTEDNSIVIKRPDDQKETRARHGLYRALIANMVKGVSEGYTIIQELVGVGYKADVKGQVLELSLGFSHNVVFELPPEIKIDAKSERGKNPTITMTSIDKQLIGQVAAKIRSFRKPEPYKGKGVLYKGEVIRKKAGKAAAEK